jgi:lysozyme
MRRLLARILGRPAMPDASAAPAPTPAEFVARFEGFRARPYVCPAGRPTIGYGTTRYPDGRGVSLSDPDCTEAKAREWLAHDLAGAESAVKLYVRVPLAEHERVALASFVYNVGANAFSRSTLLRLLNGRDRDGAARQFAVWVLAGGRELPGLVTRRAAEAALFRGATSQNG